ncbi:MAG TPA: tRNA glutamyl-Q(34) synthetase GluQRS [Polyangia bacterium]|nr:tRNA glutamyl-Q(34) synthetase GluQRS [Polyangia bacterium]
MARGRFAPSPTGELHLGGARTALVAWLAARAAGGAFVVRVEDLDRPRVVKGAESAILDDLRWVGLDWDEGPDQGGAFGPYRQSERAARFDAAVERLLAEGRAFPCFCSRADLARASVVAAPHGPADDGPRYPGTCRALAPDDIAARSQQRAPSVRLRVDDEVIEWRDGVHGPRRDRPAESVGDFVLRRADGVAAYQLAVVVDDAAMRMSDVVRGDDLLGSTARQLLLYRALGLEAPRFAHVPLVLGPDGARLSKRHGAVSVRALRDRGRSPEQVIALLASTLNLCRPDATLGARDLIADFSFDRLPRAATVLDPATLI